MDYTASSQRQRWLFTSDQLRAARQASRDKFRAEVQASSSEASSIPDISHDEEELLLRYYHIKVQAVCRELRLQRKVINTACTYIKRFYITFTPLMYDPQLMVLPCVYLACKSDECYMSAAELGRLTGVPPEAILRQEILVLQGLNFDMIVHSPYKAIQGFLEILKQHISDEKVSQVQSTAYSTMDLLLLTDAPLLYTPGQLGLAVCLGALGKAGLDLPDLVQLAVNKANQGSSDGQVQQLQDLARSISAWVRPGLEQVDQEQVMGIDKKLKDYARARAAAPDANKDKAEKAARKALKRQNERKVAEASVGVLGSTGK